MNMLNWLLFCLLLFVEFRTRLEKTVSFSHRDMFPFARRHQAATINAIPARFCELYGPVYDLFGHRHAWAQAHAEVLDEPLCESERGARIFFHLDAENVLECVLVCVWVWGIIVSPTHHSFFPFIPHSVFTHAPPVDCSDIVGLRVTFLSCHV